MQARSTGCSNRDDDWSRNAALEECWVLQGKLDKIGDFKFRIRGWSITLISALVMTSFSTNTAPALLLIAFPIVALFSWLEGYQVVLQKILSKRLGSVEQALRQNAGESSFDSPGISSTVVSEFSRLNRNAPKSVTASMFGDVHFYKILHGLVLLCLVMKVLQMVDMVWLLVRILLQIGDSMYG